VAKRRKPGGDRQDRRPAPAEPPPAPPPFAPPPSAKARLGEALRAIAIGKAAGLTIGWGIRLYAALFLGAAAVFLTVGWKSGPQRVLDAREYASFTATAQGRIVESWLAIEFDPARVGPGGFWRGSARATPCAVVEYDGDWGSPLRRAFCGKRLQFNESYYLHDIDVMATDVPFDWPREANGFAVPEMRFAPATLRWLAQTPQPEADRDSRRRRCWASSSGNRIVPTTSPSKAGPRRRGPSRSRSIRPGRAARCPRGSWMAGARRVAPGSPL
jgi:hypothetical protein